ncbi:serine carboxypeptidase-like 16 [Triticum dicoccoides]|uniref:serine carboxypeptidase-like 16 n=1 Tax=Triticum dicoccoides TaxID=85692 RepID=UPI00188F244B|nr:serine carboxypeptidase-like 16 [Triticum dicoccoides]
MASLLFLRLVVPLALLLLPLSRSATVVTHLPGFHGRLPFHLETGYVNVDEETGTELFYYFVESERSPDTDPVVLWLTGGPRCSSLIFYEVGPMKFVLAPYNGSLPELAYNPDSWSKVASIILLDSPVGTGFSYARDIESHRDVGDFSSTLHIITFLNKVKVIFLFTIVVVEWLSYHLMHVDVVVYRSPALPVKSFLCWRKFICWKDVPNYRATHFTRNQTREATQD